MSERRIVAAMLLAAVLAAAVLTAMFARRGEPPAGIGDPAVEYYTRDRSSAYAAIDRWAFSGMTQEMFTVRVEAAGYACAPRAGAVSCTRAVDWPVSRRLTITAEMDGQGARLVAASATSAVVSEWGIVRQFARVLRRVRWIEPEQFTVRGLDLDDPDLLARFAADALRGGWAEGCAQAMSPLACAQEARGRRASGFPPVDGGVNVGDVASILRQLQRARLYPAAPGRWSAAAPDPVVLVRVAGEELWLDFEGRDLAGHPLKVAIQLAVEGGRAVKMVATAGGRTREVTLGGQPRYLNHGGLQYLVPVSGPEPYRPATWLGIPRSDDQFLLEQLAEELPRADPVFGTRIMKMMLDAIAAPDRAEAGLGLYPPLLTVERRAAVLRAAGADRWLPEADGQQLVRASWPDQPVLRAAWMLAVCGAEPDAMGAQPACWSRALVTDPEAASLLRREVAVLTGWYAALPPDHPLTARLRRWHRLLDS